MRVPYRWLQEFVKIDVSTEELCDNLIMLGFSDAAVIPNEWEMLDGFVAGRVTDISPHPKVSGLSIVRVNVGFAQHTSVCGAPNVEKGQVYPVALPGASLGSGIVVEQTKISDVPSECVLCSGWEAWIDDSRDELLALGEDIAPGTGLLEALGLDEPVIEIEVTPNRPDCLGLIGIARELAAVYGKELLIPEPSLGEEQPEHTNTVRVEVHDAGGCPRYGALVCEDLEVTRSPAAVRARLRLAGLRPINNVVDATNLVLFETAHPLHAFDLEKIDGRTVIVRRARKGEKIRAIDGNEYDLDEEDLVIADIEKPIAIAGVIGGEMSEVDFSTRKVLLEGAFFHHARIRHTAKRLGISTEASYRFERGVDVGAVLYVLARAASLIHRGKTCPFYAGKIDVYPSPLAPRHILADPKRINRLLGTKIPEQEMCDYLERLGFLVSPGKELEVIVPTRRSDVSGEADIAEEVARLHGYDRIDERTSLKTQSHGRVARGLEVVGRVEQALVGMGMTEVLTESMLGPTSLDRFQMPRERAVTVRNPVGVETSFLRPSLVPGMADVLAKNLRRGLERAAAFEIGKTFLRADGGFDEVYTLAIGLCGLREDKAWHSRPEEIDFYDAKGRVESLVSLLGVPVTFESTEIAYLHPGRRASVLAGRGDATEAVGYVGEILPAVCEELGITQKAFVAELNLDALIEHSRGGLKYENVPRYPAVKRDIAVIVPEDTREADVRSLIMERGGPLLRRLRLFDVYRGEQIPPGTVSLAYSMVFQSDERTLQEEEVNALQKKVEDGVEKQLEGRIRSD